MIVLILLVVLIIVHSLIYIRMIKTINWYKMNTLLSSAFHGILVSIIFIDPYEQYQKDRMLFLGLALVLAAVLGIYSKINRPNQNNLG